MSILSVLRYRPVTVVVLVICIINFIRIHSGGISENDNAVQLGAFFRPSIDHGEVWRFLTAGFVHIQPMHLIMNLLCLYNLSFMETYVGEIWYCVILLGSIVIGSAVQYKFSNTYLAVGLSGGLYGLMAAQAVIFLFLGAFSSSAYLFSFLRTVLLNLMINFLPGIGWQAHLGGAITGIICGILIILF